MIVRYLHIIVDRWPRIGFTHLAAQNLYRRLVRTRPSMSVVRTLTLVTLLIIISPEPLITAFFKMGISILTTSKGVVSNKKAQKLSIGGEVLCHVW